MRIAFVADHGSLHTRRWVGFFAERGHEVVVVTCGGGDAPRSGPYDVVDLGPPRLGKLGYLLRIGRARAALRRVRPDVVHVHWATSYGLLGLASGVRPLVVTCHGDDVLIAPRNPLKRQVVRRVLRASELITVPSEQMRDAVRALIGSVDHVVVFQYGVDTRRLKAVSNGADRAAGGPVRLVSARPLLRLYRHDVVLDALERIREDGVAFVLDVFGDGPERGRLERRCARNGLTGSVSFYGRVPPEVVEPALAASDLYVSVAESDGASIALLEALALGPVPVLSDIPANRAWVVDGVNGVLTAIEPDALAVALRRALALDAVSVRNANQQLVAERGDRERNLSRFEERLARLFDPRRVEGAVA